MLNSGPIPQDVNRTIFTGLAGTAMPTYGDVFREADGAVAREGDAWHLLPTFSDSPHESTQTADASRIQMSGFNCRKGDDGRIVSPHFWAALVQPARRFARGQHDPVEDL